MTWLVIDFLNALDKSNHWGMQSNPIKIAGLGANWTKEYAVLFKNKLNELGFHARVVNESDRFLVLYCYRDFDIEEGEKILSQYLT